MKKATNFKFDEKTSALLEQLKESSGAASKSEVIRNALNLLKYANDAKNKNKRLIIKDGDSETEILI